MQTTITTIIAMIATIVPLLIFGYLGNKLRKRVAASHSAKFPEKPEGAVRRYALLYTFGIVVTIGIALAIAFYLWAYFNPNTKTTDSLKKEHYIASEKKIDMNENFRKGGDINYYLGAMRVANIEKMVLSPTDLPPSNPAYKENMAELLKIQKRYPDKIIAFATAWNKDLKAATIIEEAIKNGAGGIKFIDWRYSKKYSSTDAGAVNSTNMYKVYAVADKYKVPIMMRIDFKAKKEWRDQFWKVAADFPNVTFILTHYCGSAIGRVPKLDLCGETLDKFPNVYADISLGASKYYSSYFDNYKDLFRNFIIKYQDRLVWGAGITIDGGLYEGKEKNAAWVYKRMLTDFSALELRGWRSILHPGNATRHNGLELPNEVLKKIYSENPKKILKL